MKIRAHLTVLAAVILLPLLVCSAILTIVFWRAQRSALEQACLEGARAVAIALDRELQGDVRALAELARSTDLDTGDLASFYERARRAREQEVGWESIILVDTSGHELLDLRRPLGRPVPAAADLGMPSRTTGQPSVSSLVREPDGAHATLVAVPVTRGEQVRYVLVARIPSTAWLAFLSSYPRPPDVTMTLLDRNGIVIARTLDDDRWVGKQPAPELDRRRLEAGEGAVRAPGSEGGERYLAHSRSRVGGWTVATDRPAQGLEAGLRGRTLALVGGQSLAVAIAIGLAFLLGRAIARPVPSGEERYRARAAGTAPTASTADAAEHPDSAGRPSRGTLTDVRDSHPADDEARRLSDARFAALARLAPAGLIQTDAEGGREHVTDRWCELMGLASDSAAGSSWLDALHPEDRARVHQQWADAVLTHQEFTCRFRVRRAGGDERWMESRARPVGDTLGAPTSYVGVLFDITEEQRAAEQQQALLEQARAAHAEAEAASQAKDDFLGVVSHELRNPLNSIRLWLEVLRQQPADSPLARRALDGIERNTGTQAQLIEDLLDMSRIVSGRLQLRTDTVPLGPILVAVGDSVRPAATAKGVALDVTLEPTPAYVVGDPGRLYQIVMTLASNAVKFTPKGGRVAISLATRESSARILMVDSGEGIDPASLPHIFERFRQPDAGRRAVSGLGLGLSIARRLIELHGGQIRAESGGAGRGSTFVVELPLAAVTMDRPLEDRAMRSGWPNELAPLDGLRILVVEDDPSSREGLELVLRSVGARVTAVGSAQTALEAFDRERFDVMVSDIGMPGQDGYDLIRELRTRPAERGGRTRSIALTAYATAEDRRRAIAAGYELHLPKPLSPPALTHAISSLASPRSLADQPGS